EGDWRAAQSQPKDDLCASRSYQRKAEVRHQRRDDSRSRTLRRNGTVPRRPSGRVGAAPTTETAAQPMHYFITRCEVDSGDAHWRKGESREDRKVGLRN